ncbi:sulfite exporter TauE/SafE family protein [Flexivirga sp. B27]
MGDLTLGVVVLLAVISLVGGIGISAVGPGGVLPTIGLFALTPLSPATVAGTAIVTHIGTGLAGTAVYTRSGQLREPHTRRTAAWLSAAALVGTPVGVLINTHVPKDVFGIVLGLFAALVAALICYRSWREDGRPAAHPRILALVVVGLCVSLASGVVGVGGPMLTVPILVALRVPVLEALAAAQVQSIVIATVGSIGFGVHGSIDWALALLIGVPELLGVVVGWKVAHLLPGRTLKIALVVILLALAPYLMLHG